MPEETIRTPIRLIFGTGNGLYQAFTLIYENGDGSPGWLNVWREDAEIFKKVKFIEEGESTIVWRKHTKHSIFGNTEEQTIQEIRIRKDAQLKY